jgi:hypothetical protein
MYLNKCKKKFKKDGSDFLTTSVVVFVLGSIMGLFWRYEYRPRWSPLCKDLKLK